MNEGKIVMDIEVYTNFFCVGIKNYITKQITYYEICQTIEQCINLFQSQTKYAQAVKKWEKDLKFIGDYIKTVT